MARAYQWLAALTALTMLVLAFGYAALLLGFVGSLPLIATAMVVRALLRRGGCGATSSGCC